MAQNKGYMAKIGLDTSDVDKSIRELSKELKTIDRSLKDNGDSAELNAQKYTVLSKEIEATRKKLEQLQKQEATAAEALKNEQISDAEYRAYRREVENTTKALKDLETQLEEVNNSSNKPPIDPQTLANTAEALGQISEKANAAADAIANTVINTLKQAGAALANVTQQATALYGEYQQLVGGVETLFGDDAQTVIQNADRAFKTAGISANEYMETATSFAASLVSSLEGNTEQAAKSVDTALRDMADNANKMGTQMQSIQNAYQGFAKQNYTMLDNLKLGYGGTKKEMERLLSDAEKLSGIHYDISNLDDVINAIHEIQKSLGITGTTAEEAEKTITGSAASMKAAWDNLLTAMADPNGTHNLEEMVQNFVDTAITSIDNMMPSIEAALLGMGDVIEELAPVINEKLPKLISDISPSIITAVSTLTNIAIKALIDSTPMIIDASKQMMSEIWDNTDGSAKAIVEIIVGAWAAIKGIGIAADIAKFVTLIGDGGALMTAMQSIGSVLTMEVAPALAGAQTGMLAIGEAAIAILPAVAAATAAIAAAVVVANELDKAGNKLLEDSKYWNGFSDSMNDAMGRYAQLSNASKEEAQKMAEEWAEADKAALKSTKENVAGLEKAFAEMEKLSDDEIDWDVYNSLYQQIEQGKRDIEALENLVHQEDKILGEKAAIEEKAEIKAKTSASYQDFLKTTADAREQIADDFAATLEDVESQWDILYHYDKESRDEYWENRRKYLETHKNNSEAWWKAWNETEKHFADAAEKQRQQEDKERREREQAEEKAERDRLNKQKTDLQNTYRDLETEYYEHKDEYGEEWLLKKQKEYLDTLDKSSDLYKDYYNKWVKDKNSFDEKQQKAEDDAAKKRKKELQDGIDKETKEREALINEGKKAAEKLVAEYESGRQDIMNAIDKPQKMTDASGKERLIFSDYKEKLKDLKAYQKNLEKLGSLGLSASHLKEIFAMDFDTRAKYISELINMGDANRKRYLNDYEAYTKAAGSISAQEMQINGFDISGMQAEAMDEAKDNAYIKGKEAGAAYASGFGEGLSGTDLAQFNIAPYTGGITADQAKLYGLAAPVVTKSRAAAEAPIKGDLTINVAGTQVMKTGFEKILKAMKNSGGVLDI